MKSLAVSLMFLATLSLPFSMSAHDAKMHKGKATQGEITSVSGDRFEMKTAMGTVAVTLSSKTKFEHGDEAVDKTHLKVGEHVSVFGTKVSKGEISANSVLLGAAGSDDHGKMEGMDHSKMKGMDGNKMKGMDNNKMEGMDHGKMNDTKPAPKP